MYYLSPRYNYRFTSRHGRLRGGGGGGGAGVGDPPGKSKKMFFSPCGGLCSPCGGFF